MNLNPILLDEDFKATINYEREINDQRHVVKSCKVFAVVLLLALVDVRKIKQKIRSAVTVMPSSEEVLCNHLEEVSDHVDRTKAENLVKEQLEVV